MQAIYHRYYVTKAGKKKKLRVDLRKFFREFAAWKDATFKMQFTAGDENLFLIPLQADVHFFAITRDKEVIKQIKKSTLDVADLMSRLEAGTSVGFASYVLIENDHLAFASKLLSPRAGRFADFVNDVFQALNIQCRFHMDPIMHSIGRSDVSKLKVAGSFSMKVRKSSGLWSNMAKLLGIKRADKDLSDIGDFEVKVRPARARSNTISSLADAAQHIPEGDLLRFDAKAKLDVGEKLTDLYIIGQGALRESLKGKHDTELAFELLDRIKKNAILSERLKEYRSDVEFKQVDDLGDLGLDWTPPRRSGPRSN